MAISIHHQVGAGAYSNGPTLVTNVSAVGQKIVVCVSSGYGHAVTGITDSIGNTYTKAVSTSTYTEIWTAVSVGTSASNVITLAVPSWGPWGLQAYVLDGAGANGATGTQNGGPGYPSVSITPQAVGSLIFVAGMEEMVSGSGTPTSNATLDRDYTYASRKMFVERLTNPTADTSEIQIGLTSPAADTDYVMAALEIKLAEGAHLEGDGSSSTSGTGALSTGIPLGASGSSVSSTAAALTALITLAAAGASTCAGSGTVTDLPLSGSSTSTSSGTALMDSALIFAADGLSESSGTAALTTIPAPGVGIESSGYFTGYGLEPTTTTFVVGSGGRRIIVCIGRSSYAINGVTDSLGNTYTRIAERGNHTEIWTAWSYGGGANAVTVHSNNYIHCAVTAYSLAWTQGVTPTNIAVADIASAIPTVDITPGAIRSRVFVAGWADNVTGTPAPTANATLDHLDTGGGTGWTEYLTDITPTLDSVTIGWSEGSADIGYMCAVEILAPIQTHALAGTSTSITGGPVDLSAQIQLVGDTTVGYGVGSGSLDTAIQLTAEGLSVTGAENNLSIDVRFSGDGLSECSGTGDLYTEILLLGASESQTVGNADLDTFITLAAEGLSECSGSAALDTAIQLTGSAVGASAGEAGLNSVVHHLEGSTVSQSTGAADLSSEIVLEASGLSETGIWGSSLTTSIPLDASGAASSEGTGALDALIQLAANGLGETFGNVTLTDLALYGAGVSECSGAVTLGDLALSGTGLSECSGAVALSTEVRFVGDGVSETRANGLLVDNVLGGMGVGRSTSTADLLTKPRSKIFEANVFEAGLPVLLTNILGLPAGRVIWESQSQNRPALPYVSLWANGSHRTSPMTSSWLSENPDGYVGNPNANPPVVGTELREEHLVPCEFTLRVQAHSASVMGSQSADKLLRKIVNALDLASTRLDLQKLGAWLVETGPVMSIPALVETRFEGHAALDVRLRIMDGGSETMTYIESAEATWVPGEPRQDI